MPEMWEQEGLSCAWSCLRGDIQEELNALGYRPSATENCAKRQSCRQLAERNPPPVAKPYFLQRNGANDERRRLRPRAAPGCLSSYPGSSWLPRGGLAALGR